MTATMLY